MPARSTRWSRRRAPSGRSREPITHVRRCASASTGAFESAGVAGADRCAPALTSSSPARAAARRGARAHYARRARRSALRASAAELDALAAALPPGRRRIRRRRARRRCARPRRAPISSRASALPDVVIANAGVSRGTLTEHAEDLRGVPRGASTPTCSASSHTFQPFVARDARRAGAARWSASRASPGFRGLAGRRARIRRRRPRRSRISRACASSCAAAASPSSRSAPGYIATPMTAQESLSGCRSC